MVVEGQKMNRCSSCQQLGHEKFSRRCQRFEVDLLDDIERRRIMIYNWRVTCQVSKTFNETIDKMICSKDVVDKTPFAEKEDVRKTLTGVHYTTLPQIDVLEDDLRLSNDTTLEEGQLTPLADDEKDVESSALKEEFVRPKTPEGRKSPKKSPKKSPRPMTPAAAKENMSTRKVVQARVRTR